MASTPLSRAHLEAVRQGIDEAEDHKLVGAADRSYFSSRKVREYLLDKYVRNETDPTVQKKNFDLIATVSEEDRRQRAMQSGKVMEATPSLKAFADVDPLTGAIKARPGIAGLSEALRKAGSVEASKARVESPSFADLMNNVWNISPGGLLTKDPFQFKTPGLDTGIGWVHRNLMQGIAQVGIGTWTPYKDLMQMLGVATGKWEDEEEFNRFYDRLVYTNEMDAAGSSAGLIIGEAARMVPFLILMSGFGGGAAAAGGRGVMGGASRALTAGASRLGVLGRVATTQLTPGMIPALSQMGVLGKMTASFMSFGGASALTSPVSEAVNPETGKREPGYIDPQTGEFKPISFLRALGDQGIHGVIGGAGGALAALGGHFINTMAGRWMGRMTATEGAKVAMGTWPTYVKGTLNLLNEINAFSAASYLGNKVFHSAEMGFWDTWKANAVLLGAFKGMHLAAEHRLGFGKPLRATAEGIQRPTGLRRLIFDYAAKEAGMPGEATPTYNDKIGVATNILRRAREKGGEGTVVDLVKEHAKEGRASRLGGVLRRAGVGAYDHIDVEIALAYARKGMRYDGVHGRRLLEDPRLQRDVLNNADGHSSALEGPAESLREFSLTKEEADAVLKGEAAGKDIVDLTGLRGANELAPDRKLPEPEPAYREGAGAELESRVPEVPDRATQAEVKQIEAAAKDVAEQNQRAVDAAYEVQRRLKESGFEDLIDADPAVRSTVKVLKGISDHFETTARNALNRMVRSMKDTGTVAIGALRRMKDAIAAEGLRLSGVETVVEARTRLSDLHQRLPKMSDAEVMEGIPAEVQKLIGNISGAEARALRWAVEYDPMGTREVLQNAKTNAERVKAKETVLTRMQEFVDGRMGDDAITPVLRGGQRVNDISIAMEEAVNIVRALPRTAKGLFTIPRKLTPAWESIKALGTAVGSMGMWKYADWKAGMVERTGLKLAEAEWKQLHAWSMKNWEAGVKNVVGNIPGMKELLDLINAGMHAHRWYDGYTSWASKLFTHEGKPLMVTWRGADGQTISRSAFEVFSMLLSATSSRSAVAGNVELATKAYVELATKGENARFDIRARDFEVVRDGRKKRWYIVDAETGERMENQPIISGQTYTGERRTFFDSEAAATTRANQLIANAKKRAVSMVKDQRQLLEVIRDIGDIPITAGKQAWRKRHNFYKALTGDHEAIVLDIWGMRAMGWYKMNKDGSPVPAPDKMKDGKLVKGQPVQEFGITDWRYNHYEEVVRMIAKNMGLTPRQVQAAMWMGTKEAWKKKGWSAKEVRAEDSVEPTLRLKLLSKGKFRNLLKLDFKRLAELEPAMMEAALKEGITPESLKMTADWKQAYEARVKERIGRCLG